MSNLDLSLQPKKVDVTIEYCVPCDYSRHALQAAQELIQNEQHRLQRLAFIMGSKGVFEVKAGEQILFSKKTTQRFPQPGEILSRFQETLDTDRAQEAEPQSRR